MNSYKKKIIIIKEINRNYKKKIIIIKKIFLKNRIKNKKIMIINK